MRRTWWGVGLVLLLAGCDAPEAVREYFRTPITPHEAYYASLVESGLGGTALGQEWLSAADRALSQPLTVVSPYREEGFFPPGEVTALGFRVSVLRGQMIDVDVHLVSEDAGRVFLDVFEAAPDSTRLPLPVAHADSDSLSLEFHPRRGGDFILRLQPELLRGGRYEITIRTRASLAFPVLGHTIRSAQSLFGVDRDGGRRSHHGVDIFARRGTPVIAAANGRVTRVSETAIGGKVVWMRDRFGHSLYYAHLDRQAVRSGAQVQVGDTLGFVGNTGNARTTPPHLHFGVYRRGPVNPYNFIRQLPSEPEVTSVDLAGVGQWRRIRSEGVRLRRAPSTRGLVLGELERYTPLKVAAAAGPWYRVETPDGVAGFVAGRLTESTDQPLGSTVADSPISLRTSPGRNAPALEVLAPGERVAVLGSFGNFLFVQSPAGNRGWMTNRPVTADR